ncbi:hypothetical protein CHLRE_03g145327v5 [Chlamydomonas reinhardtii]|uniref:Uncharacterized protein n=1 Tax=Chlamydomonas reinhardtii TaxID=3055 RepID=A0A2K3DV86_CHLRE|nr:uncharacterized protein CHLRE_03g145327v5 [Chlamydomonas reinhardtii]PNW84460.1 hypothetical protein CHLRE_03g145327v5 [Chlamydomonas reinhardtii]
MQNGYLGLTGNRRGLWKPGRAPLNHHIAKAGLADGWPAGARRAGHTDTDHATPTWKHQRHRRPSAHVGKGGKGRA